MPIDSEGRPFIAMSALSLLAGCLFLTTCGPEYQAAPATEATTTTASVVHLLEPGPNELLFGPTRIVAGIDATARPTRMRFYLDNFPRPICDLRQPPWQCEFDAGRDLQGRAVRVEALGAAGEVLGSAQVETLAYPKPERVVRHTLRVPLVIRVRPSSDAPDVSAIDFACHYAGKPCRVVSAERLDEVEWFPVSLEILIDTSGSVEIHRKGTLDALRQVIDTAPVGVEISIVEFGATYSRLVPFTSDTQLLEQGMLKLSGLQTHTCLFTSMQRSLATLRARPGHKMLFVMSDGEEACGTGSAGLAGMDGLHDTALASRQSGAPIYVYRQNPMMRRTKRSVAYEGLPAETGGLLFSTGDLYGMEAAMGDLVQDLRSTWLLDIDLPEVLTPDTGRRLELEPTVEIAGRWSFPQYWPANYREASLIDLLATGDANTRAWAAGELVGFRTEMTLSGLLRALRREDDDEARSQELSAIRQLTASLLLHGDETQQKAALAAIDRLETIDFELLEPLWPALRVYPRLEPPTRLRRRVERLLSARAAETAE